MKYSLEFVLNESGNGKVNDKKVFLNKNEFGHYTGDIANFKMHGMGKLIFPNGAIYKGEWKENKRQGKGQFYFTDFATYNGNWENDMRNGQGEFIFPDGASYRPRDIWME
jgi:hypothetical protein